MTDLITTVHRPDFASVQLATDLQKLEEDWLTLEHRMTTRPTALDGMSDLARTSMASVFRAHCAWTRRNLIDGAISFDIARVVRDVLEAAFHVVRRAINGIPQQDEPIPYWPIDEIDDEWPADEACS